MGQIQLLKCYLQIDIASEEVCRSIYLAPFLPLGDAHRPHPLQFLQPAFCPVLQTKQGSPFSSPSHLAAFSTLWADELRGLVNYLNQAQVNDDDE